MSVLNETYPYYLASRAEFANAYLAVIDKYKLSCNGLSCVALCGGFDRGKQFLAPIRASPDRTRQLPPWVMSTHSAPH